VLPSTPTGASDVDASFDASVGAPTGESDAAAGAALGDDAGPPQALRRDGVLGSALALAGGEVGGRALAFVGAAYLSRQLGVSGFGLVGFAIAFSGYFGLLVRGGAARIGAREVARAPDEAPALVASLAVLRCLISAVAFLGLWVAVGFLGLAPDAQALVRLAGLALFPLALDSSWACKGLGQGGRVAAAMVAGQGVSVVVLLLLVRGPADVAWVPVAQFIGELLAALALLLPLAVRARRWVFGAAFALLRRAAAPGATSLLRAIILTFDVVLLGLLGRQADVGAYTAAYRVTFLVLGIGVALTTSLWPAAARAQTPAALGQVITRALELLAAIGLPLVVGGIVLADPLMSLLFGREFAVGGPMLRWLLLSVGLALAHGAYSVALLASGATRRELGIMATAAAVNVLCNLVLIPTYGARGAAVVTALSEGVALTLCVLAGRRAGWHTGVRGMLPSAAAAGTMAVALWAMGAGMAVPVRMLLGGLVYVVALGLFGWPAEVASHVAAVRHALQVRRRRSAA